MKRGLLTLVLTIVAAVAGVAASSPQDVCNFAYFRDGAITSGPTIDCGTQGAPVTTNTDAFTYSNGELNSTSSGQWVNIETGFGEQLSIVSNQVSHSGSFNSYYRYNATYAGAAVYSQAKLATMGAGFEMGVVINLVPETSPGSANSSGYFLGVYDAGGGVNHFEIFRNDLGSGTVISGTATPTLAAGDVVKLSNDGSGHLTAYLNGVSTATATDTNYTAAKVGIYMSGVSTARLDDWEGGDVSAGAVPPRTLATLGVGN